MGKDQYFPCHTRGRFGLQIPFHYKWTTIQKEKLLNHFGSETARIHTQFD